MDRLKIQRENKKEERRKMDKKKEKRRTRTKILLINICSEKLHYFEFVKPIEDIIKKEKLKWFTRYYKKVNKKDIKRASKIIICGTSLKDNSFLKNIKKFSWIKTFNRPLLGICAGMQIIGLLFGGKLKRKTEIGYYTEIFKNFLGLKDKVQVYHLHNNYVDFGFFNNKLNDQSQFNDQFKLFSVSHGKEKIPQAVKHKNKEIYAVLFHPEVRQKKFIANFCKL